LIQYAIGKPDDEYIIPSSVTRIGEDAFCGCSNLTFIEIPDGVISIGNYAFYGCSSLTSIEIPNGVTSICEWTFLGCSSLTSIEIPDSMTSIGEGAFDGCSYLEVVNYTGTEAEWNAISIGSYNYDLTDATIVYNYVG